MTPKEMSSVFDKWNKGELGSFLIEITRDILGKKRLKGSSYVTVDFCYDVDGAGDEQGISSTFTR